MRLSRIVVALTLFVGSTFVATGTVAAAAHPFLSPVSATAATVDFAEFADVSCPNATSCYAFGFKEAAIAKTLVEHWDGTSWSIMATPNSAAGPSTSLSGGACASDTSCFAVGKSGDFDSCCSLPNAFITRWDGSTWTSVPTAALPGSRFSTLTSVACPSSSSCFAVGKVGFNGPNELNGMPKTLVEHWNGTTWAHVASPNPSGDTETILQRVTCPNVTRCVAVGTTYSSATEIGRSLIETWDGTRWTITATPGTRPTRYGEGFYSVTCTNATHCFAVGVINDSKRTNSLVWRLVGLKWVPLASPTSSEPARFFDDMTCISLTSCFAVGYVGPASGAARTLIEHWDGLHWTISPSPNVPFGPNELLAAACASATTCFAVGDASNEGAHSLIERWNGTTWSLSAHPQPTF